MRVAFRVDASIQMGIGHLKRCLALAHAMRGLDTEVVFVTRNLGIDTGRTIEGDGFRQVTLPEPTSERAFVRQSEAPRYAAWAGLPQEVDADQTCAVLSGIDWVVVDHYSFDRRWQERVTCGLGARICVIDDLADREHCAQVVVDHNWALDHRARYGSFIQPRTRLLAGPRFALLGPGYATAAPYDFRSEARSVGIFMGGTDAGQVSAVAVQACREVAAFRGRIEVVTTSANPHLQALASLCRRWPATDLSVDLPDLAGFFGRHDLQIGAGGVASWERCCLGAPTLALKCADNQSVVIDALAAQGVVRTVPDISVPSVGRAVGVLIADVEGRRNLSIRARVLVDGRGAQRVASALLAQNVLLRPATVEDAELIHEWRNDPRTRRYFHDPSEVSLDAHLRWWSRSLVDQERLLMIACCGGRSVGSLRLDRSATVARISIFLDPDLTGLGLGVGMLRAAQRLAVQHSWRLERLEADVHPDNKASVSIFEAAGFSRTGSMSWQWSVRN